MRFGKIALAVVAAVSMVSGPVMAQALSPAAKIASVKRAGADRNGENKAGSGILIGVLVAAAIIGVIIVAGGNDKPKSP